MGRLILQWFKKDGGIKKEIGEMKWDSLVIDDEFLQVKINQYSDEKGLFSKPVDKEYLVPVNDVFSFEYSNDVENEVLDLSPLSHLTKLKRLTITNTNISEIDLYHIMTCSQLLELNLSNNNLLSIDLKPLIACSQLKVLRLSNNPLNYVDLEYFIALDQIELIELVNTNIDHLDVKSISNNRNLRIKFTRNQSFSVFGKEVLEVPEGVEFVKEFAQFLKLDKPKPIEELDEAKKHVSIVDNILGLYEQVKQFEQQDEGVSLAAIFDIFSIMQKEDPEMSIDDMMEKLQKLCKVQDS